MPKAALITLDTDLLGQALGVALDVTIVSAQIDYAFFQHPVLQLLITGESLPVACEIEEGQRVVQADLVLHMEQRRCEIVPRRARG